MRRAIVGAGLLWGLAGCAGAQKVPTEQLVDSQVSIRAAEEAGATQVPDAARHLELAEGADARRAVSCSMTASATTPRSTCSAPQADAELALALAQEAPARADAQRADGAGAGAAARQRAAAAAPSSRSRRSSSSRQQPRRAASRTHRTRASA